MVTDNNFTYMDLGDTFNYSTILTIDDNGIIRLIGTYKEADLQHQVSQEINFTQFKTSQTYVFPVSFIQVTFNNPFGPITN